MTPELPPQSPARVGDEPAAAPAITMSLKSQSVAERVPTVRVRWEPSVSERKKMRRVAVAPAHVRVPVTVAFPPMLNVVIPTPAGGEIVKLVNVGFPCVI